MQKLSTKLKNFALRNVEYNEIFRQSFHTCSNDGTPLSNIVDRQEWKCCD